MGNFVWDNKANLHHPDAVLEIDFESKINHSAANKAPDASIAAMLRFGRNQMAIL